jgi:hypothetical protein
MIFAYWVLGLGLLVFLGYSLNHLYAAYQLAHTTDCIKRFDDLYTAAKQLPDQIELEQNTYNVTVSKGDASSFTVTCVTNNLSDSPTITESFTFVSMIHNGYVCCVEHFNDALDSHFYDIKLEPYNLVLYYNEKPLKVFTNTSFDANMFSIMIENSQSKYKEPT